jgi:glycosyltransferase involved in cell wall biosynthesis
MDEIPFVSIVIPCRNEEGFIGACLESLLKGDYPQDRLEVLVVDGMSCDGTRKIVASHLQGNPCIRVLDNPSKTTPVAMNLGIRASRGDVVIIASAHARFDRKYITRCVEAIRRYGADNVGGIMRMLPREPGLTGNAIALSLSHRFGVGNSYFRIHTDEPRWVDTVFGGCYRREVFQRVGFFNEKLARSQDMEFNRRLKKAGGKTLLAPDIVCYYYARSDLKSFKCAAGRREALP